MYAIIETGGKQYRAETGKTLQVEKLNAAKGETVVFDRVLMINDGKETRLGKPHLEKCAVEGRVLAQRRDRKIIVFKYKAKKNYRRKQGHRQPFTEIIIEKITVNS